ncbi:MAG TPA: hypothetical protein VF656_02020 [Pyrinomonadaceae bacterium]|jgi:hypothetical protein
MPNRPVTSREYKLMLNTDRFEDSAQGTDSFFALLKFLIEKGRGAIKETQTEEKRRLTSYLDTPEMALRQAGYALRLRDESAGGGAFQLNLKYRSSDRYLSAERDLSTPLGGDIKFEEDVLPSASKFSHSNTLESNKALDADTVGKVVTLFPGLGVLNLGADVAVKTVNDFTAAEVVRKLCKFQFGGPPNLKASLSFWRLPSDAESWPLVCEFSFDYDAPKGGGADKLEQYPIATVEGANRLFEAMQGQAGWVNLSATTKTAFALEAL